ncbi:DNA-entry nuclease [Paenibacillus ottowii]|uniref:DNA-entry nuclease n=1 Tax=Paenibacillus ottowii TaxID=2315729 RepID=UPI00272F513F|nr:DNA-entry nuclease [Paenibacillus ottowii]MDP1513094.1 DNA-entry nuclease [Paenibacillus ottowii]
MEIEYDQFGKMKFHPDFHFAHGKAFSLEDLEYLCTFYEYDGPRSISLALGKTERTCASKYNALKKRGLLEYYKKLYERRF